MAKRVDINISSVGGESRTTSTLDFLDDVIAKRSVKTQIKRDVGNFLIDTILESVAEQKTPVSGEKYKASLSREYKKRKQAEGGSSVADMELFGDMLDSLKFKNTSTGIEIGWFGKQANKADGHLHFSGRDSFAPRRRFIPGEGQKFKRDVESEIQRIIAEHIDAKD